jgi:flagellar biosynthesis protein FlhA
MAEAQAQATQSPVFGIPFLRQLAIQSSKRADIFFALGIICILVILILPLPPFLLDVALAISITLSVIILMTVLFVEKPLHLTLL